MPAADIVLLLTKAAKFNYLLSPNFLKIISETLTAERHAISRDELVQIIYSFKDYDNSIPAMSQMRGAVVQILRERQGETAPWNSRSLAMCLYGLKNMNYEMRHVPQIIDSLLGFLKDSPRDFSLQSLCHSFRGLTNLSSDMPLTRELLAILHSKLIVCSSGDLLETKDIVNCYRSFQSLSLAASEASSLVAALLPHIDRYNHYVTSGSVYPEKGRAPFSPKDLVDMYRGVAHFDLRYEESVQLFHHLLRWLQRPLTPLSVKDTSRILHTMKDKNKGVSPIKETVIFLCDSLFSVTQWDPVLCTAKTPLALDEVTLVLQALQSSPLTVPKEVNRSFRSLINLITFSLRQSSAFLTSNELYRLFHGGAVLSSGQQESRELLLVLGEKLQHPSLELSPKTVSVIVKSLRYMDPAHQEVLSFLELLTLRLESLPQLTIPEKWGCIYGLQSLSSSHPTVRSFLKVLNSKFVPYPSSYRHTAQSVGCTFFGLQLLQPIHSEVRHLMRIIFADYQALSIRLDNQAISNLFFGLQNLHDPTVEESRLLVQLTIQILKRNQQSVSLSIAGISQLMIGIRNFSSDDSQALELLEIITHYLRQSTEVFDSRTVVSCVTNLKNFSVLAPQTETFLSLLCEKIELMSRNRPTERLSQSQLMDLFSGLKRMSTVTPALHTLLTLLHNNVTRLSAREISPTDLLKCLVGLQQLSLSDSSMVLNILHSLLDQVDHTISRPYSVSDYADYLSSLQHLPPGDSLTLELMAYLIPRQPRPETVSPLSVALIGAIVLGLRNQNPKWSETKELLIHAAALIESSNRQHAGHRSLSPAEEADVLRLCRGLAEFQSSSEFEQLVDKIAEALSVTSPRLTSETKATIANLFVGRDSGGVGQCRQVKGLLAVVSGLASDSE